jgi:hypothetical protein
MPISIDGEYTCSREHPREGEAFARDRERLARQWPKRRMTLPIADLEVESGRS